MIKRLDHVCVTVEDYDAAVANYAEVLGLKPFYTLTNEERGIKVAMLATGNCSLEIIGPVDPKGGAARFAKEWGYGVHHVCLEVDDIERDLKALAAKGINLKDKQGIPGPFGKIAYLGKGAVPGALIQFVQKQG